MIISEPRFAASYVTEAGISRRWDILLATSVMELPAHSHCHGPNATGLPNLGKDLTTSEFVSDMTNLEFVTFVQVGRPVGDQTIPLALTYHPKGETPR